MRTRWRVTRTAAVVFSGVLAATVAAPALAQPTGPVSEGTKDAARNNYRAAEMKFKEGNYTLALQYYTAAENILPVPATKYKIAVCNDRLGNTAEAVRWYQAFLAANPPAKMANEINDAQARVSALARAGGRIRVLASPANAPGLSVSIDGGPPQPAGAPLNTTVGRHRVVIQAQGYNAMAVEIDVGPGEMRDVPISLTPGGGAVPVGPGGGDVVMVRRSNVPAYVLFGVAGAGVVLGGVFGGLALKAKGSFNDHPRGNTSDADAAERNAKIADASFGVGIAAAVVGVVLIATNRPRPVAAGSAEPLSRRAFFTPYAGPTGAGATAGLTF